MKDRMIYYFFLKIKYIKSKFLYTLILMTLALIYMCIETIKRSPKDLYIGPLDVLCNINSGVGILGYPSQIMIIIPAYLFLLINMLDFDNNPTFIIRNKSRKYIWNSQIVNSFFLAFVFSLIVVVGGYFISGFILGDFENYWSNINGFNYYMIGNSTEWYRAIKIFHTSNVLPLIFIGIFLGLSYIGALVSMLKNIFESKYIWSILFIVLFFEAITGKFSFLIKYTTITIEEFADPVTIVFGNLYLLVSIIVLYLLGLHLKNNKDFLSKGEK